MDKISLDIWKPHFVSALNPSEQKYNFFLNIYDVIKACFRRLVDSKFGCRHNIDSRLQSISEIQSYFH